MFLRLALFALLSSATAWAGQPSLCEPAARIRAELVKAAALPVADPTAFEQNVAPFQALREHYPGNLFVHERYQDAVQQYGIEGHLRQLTQDYQNLTLEHSGDLMYRYLFARSLIGRGTASALQHTERHPGRASGFRARPPRAGGNLRLGYFSRCRKRKDRTGKTLLPLPRSGSGAASGAAT